MEPVPECQSPLFLHVDAADPARVRLYFSAPPEAPTTRGFASILATGLDGCRLAADGDQYELGVELPTVLRALDRHKSRKRRDAWQLKARKILARYDTADAALFVGRERLVDELAARRGGALCLHAQRARCGGGHLRRRRRHRRLRARRQPHRPLGHARLERTGHRSGVKHHIPALIGPTPRCPCGLGIGQIAGNHVEPTPLSVQAGYRYRHRIRHIHGRVSFLIAHVWTIIAATEVICL